MRQSVVITLIVMGSLLVMAPLITGALVVCAVAQAGRDVSTNVPGQDWSYQWVCLGVGILLAGVGIVGECLSGRWAISSRRIGEVAQVSR